MTWMSKNHYRPIIRSVIPVSKRDIPNNVFKNIQIYLNCRFFYRVEQLAENKMYDCCYTYEV